MGSSASGLVDLLLPAPILAAARRAVRQQGSRKVAQHGEGTLVMAAIPMLSLAGAGATRSHCVPAPDLWALLDADLAAMGFFLPRSDLFTALPAERFASLAGGICWVNP